jgi:putative glycosyltransferase (TIGR04348 family)
MDNLPANDPGPVYIRLITPAPPGSRAGNRTTATRWARLLRALGHRVDITTAYTGGAADLMIALHAWRSAASIARFAEAHPDTPRVVVITGTDAYRFVLEDPATTRRSLALAHRLVGLHASIGEALPPEYRARLRVIYQSAPPGLTRRPYRRGLRVCVAGHLRDEKDPLRPAWAVRDLPGTSGIRVDHYGSAHSPEWAMAARAEMARNPRYRWHGEVPHGRLRRVYAQAHLLVLPSRMEGGANAISEAVMAGLPVIASRIPGSVGLLGEDYPGYFPVEDTSALRALLLRAETEPPYLAELQAACAARRPLFTAEREQAALAALLEELRQG